MVCCVGFSFFFFFKKKTAYEVRISDWISDVCSSDLNDEAGEAVVAASGGKAAYFRCDIAQEEDVKALVAQTLAAFGGLDGAFNNAAIPQAGLPLAEVSLERFRQSMDINVTG